MIHIQRTFSPVKFTITEPQDIKYLIMALEIALRSLEERWFGFGTKDISPKNQTYYNTIKDIVGQLHNVPTQLELK